MNSAQIVGNITKDIDLKYTSGTNAKAFTRFTVAVPRRFKNAEGKYDADFINCTAWGGTAEFISKYFHKGSRIGITGEIRTGSYEKDGQRIYTTDINVNTAEFVGGKSDGGNVSKNNTDSTANTDSNTFMAIPDGIDEELPFA